MVIFVITILIVLYNFFQLKVMKKEYVDFFGYSFFEVISDSMAPELKKKDVIIVKKQDNYNVDSIITYKIDSAFVTHRIIEINNNFYLTRGDANNSNDSVPVEKENVVGSIILKVKGLGVARDIVLDVRFLAAAIVLIFAFNNYFHVDDDYKKYQKQKKKMKKDFKITHKKIIEEI